MLPISKVLINLIKPPAKRQEPNWNAYWLVVAATFFLFHLPHAGKLQALADIPYFFEGGCSLLIAYLGLMFASVGDIFLRERKALKTKVAATALEKSTPVEDALEVVIGTMRKVLIIFENKSVVSFKFIVFSSCKSASKLHSKLGGIIHTCLTPRLIPTPSICIA